MKAHIQTKINEAISVKQRLITMADDIESMAKIIVDSYNKGGKLIFFGNGGSAADAQHMATEYVCLLDSRNKRPSMNAISLTTNTSALTATSNDFSVDHIFSRQMEALVNENDVAVGISTSGNSKNVLEALNLAKEKGARVIGWTGSTGGKMNDLPMDFVFKAPSDDVNRIQEIHVTMGHILCSAVENELHFKNINASN
tara:strand:+ start:526 stop:1122 length:597 start_codon:yes stop_codon:yes gene_type:complete